MIGLKTAKDGPAKPGSHLVGVIYPGGGTCGRCGRGSTVLILLLPYESLKLLVVLVIVTIIVGLSPKKKYFRIVRAEALFVSGFCDSQILLLNLILFASFQDFQIDIV
tara:strand:- start:390 stop:713 length:324 start_codon:yes stop_codon:yes gene_type:complete